MNIGRIHAHIHQAHSQVLALSRGDTNVNLTSVITKLNLVMSELEASVASPKHAPAEDLLAGAIQVALSNSEMVARLGGLVDRLLREREEIHVEGPQDPKILLEIRSLSEWRVLHLCLGTSSGLLSEYNREIAAKIRKRMPPFPGKNEL